LMPIIFMQEAWRKKRICWSSTRARNVPVGYTSEWNENLNERREDTMKAILIQCSAVLVIFVAGVWVGKTTTVDAAAKGRVFEIRTYTANEGKLDALHARFRNHTTKLF